MKTAKSNPRRNVHKRTRSTTMIEIVKPPSDRRSYRVVILPNGITAMLISEMPELPPDLMDKQGHEVVMEIDESLYQDGEAAAALCIGVGSFSDHPEIPGLAHFMEHMVFMGSQKFPKENYWDEMLAKCGGESNAWTDCERTCFFFVCQQNCFVKALDVFAQFFIKPLFLKSSVDREIMAVDNECQMVASNDNERMRGVMAYELVEPGHPMGKFMAGNVKSLKHDPETKNINVYEQLQTFYQKMYSAHYMTLVIHSMDTLDTIEGQIIKIFTKIPNNDIPRPKFIKPPFQEKNLNKLIKVIPMGDVNKLELVWALPPLMEHYRARVIEYFSLLLGHEGKGSILSILRKRQLALEIAGGNDMTGFTHNSTWSGFMLSVRLTELGIKNYEQVLEVIFQYINLLKKQLPEHVFEEQKHIQETKYIFKDQESIYNYAEELAENMHLYPPEHYLCGRSLFFEYNEQLLRDCLDFLRPQGMLVMLFNRFFSLLNNLSEEPWLKTKYLVSEFSPLLIKHLSTIEPTDEFSLPEPNPYIATNFNLIKVQKATKYPVVVMNDEKCRMWYMKDTKYGMPNAYVYFNFISSVISATPANVALGDVYLTLLLHRLTETLYNATLAGYEYSVEATPEGIIFIIGGYSEKMKLVTADTLKVFEEATLDEEDFNSVVSHLKQVYMNELIKPVELARAVRYSVLELKDPSLLERYEQLGSLTFRMLQDYKEEFHNKVFVEGLVTGNLRSQDAVEICGLARSIVQKPLPESEFPKPNMMELPVGDFKCFLPSTNKEDTNSCVVHYYQQGVATFYKTCLNDLLAVAMNEPLFNTLRTEHQLGYSVYCQPLTTHGVLGFLIVVECQANKFSMTHVDEVMTTFLKDFQKSLENIPKEKFSELVESQASLREADDADLYDESLRYWNEIVKQAYVFDRNRQECEAMKKITRQALIEWYRDLVSPKKRKLSIMVEGCNKEACEFTPATPPEKGLRSLLRELKTCAASKLPGAAPKEPEQTKEPSIKETLLQFQELGPNYITSICAFKSSLKQYKYYTVDK